MDKKSLIAQISQNLASIPPPEAAPVAAPPELKKAPSARKALVIKQPRPSAPKETPVEIPPIQKKPPLPKGSATGKQIAFWFDDDDRAILQEMGMLLYTQGIKPSHNLVIRAALRMMPKDHRFFEKAQELLQKDGRKLRHMKED